MPYDRQPRWKAKYPDILPFTKVGGEPNRSAREATYKDAGIQIAKVVMLGHIELLARLAMNHPRPSRMAFKNMAVGEDFVPSDKNACSKTQLVGI